MYDNVSILGTPMIRCLFAIALTWSAPAALAQETDEVDDWDSIDLLGDELPEGQTSDDPVVEEPEGEVPRPEAPTEGGDDLLDDGDIEFEDDIDFGDESVENDDLLFEDEEEEEVPVIQREGQDTATLYRRTQRDFAKMPPDEEVLAWEKYVEDYPHSLFRQSITARIDELMTQQYASPEVETGIEGERDAAKAEIFFDQPMQMESFNPRTRVHVAFEWGIPSYANLKVDYEHKFIRTFSAHLGIGRRPTGWGLEIGPKWAIVKSARHQTVLSLHGDFRLNFSPTFVSFKPYLSAGRVFGNFQIFGQIGAEFEVRKFGGIRLLGGLHASYRIVETVGMFVETHAQMKNLEWRGGPFAFNTISFGMRFYPKLKRKPDEYPIEINASANVPYYTNYWQYHFGSIMGQFNYYVK